MEISSSAVNDKSKELCKFAHLKLMRKGHAAGIQDLRFGIVLKFSQVSACLANGWLVYEWSFILAILEQTS